MPLSENEQRILADIERHLSESDPHLGREAAARTEAGPISLRWGAAGVVLGFAAMVATLQIHVLLAFGAFLLMLAGAIVLERSIRSFASTDESADPTTRSNLPRPLRRWRRTQSRD